MARLEIHLPVFNEEQRLPRMLDCLSRQTFADYQVVIHDNGSTDGTAGICHQAQKNDPRIQVDRIPHNTGAVSQGYRFRYGCKSDYVANRSANDLIADTYFEEMIKLLDDDPAVVLAYSHGLLVNGESEVVGLSSDEDRIDTRLVASTIERAAMVIERYGFSFPLWGVYRRSALEKTRPIQYAYASDHVMICEMALYGDVVSTIERLDFREVTRNEIDFFPWGVTNWAQNALEENARGVLHNSAYYGVAQHLPFTNLIWGHIEMFSLALIAEEMKPKLADLVVEIIGRRFGSYLQLEIDEFLSALQRDLPQFETYFQQLSRDQRAIRLGKIRMELNKLRLITTAPQQLIVDLELRLARLPV